MRFVGAAGEDVEAKDFGDEAGGFAGAVDAMIGELVGREALRVQSAEAGFVAEERTAGHGHAACEQDFDGCIEPDDGDASGAEKLGRALLSVGAAAEREHDRFFLLEDAAERGAKLVGFDLAKFRFAEAFENFGDAHVGRGFDAVVEVDEAPGELAREQSAHGGLARAQESGEAEQRYALLRRKRARRLAHAKWIRLMVRLGLSTARKTTSVRAHGTGAKPSKNCGLHAKTNRASGCGLYHCRKRVRLWRGRCRRCRRD